MDQQGESVRGMMTALIIDMRLKVEAPTNGRNKPRLLPKGDDQRCYHPENNSLDDRVLIDRDKKRDILNVL